MLSVKPERPVDALTIAVSREIDRVARDLELPYFLAGAMARDIPLTHVFGIAIGRATRDVDFGVAVGNWEQFDLIKDRLIETGRFSSAAGIAQRIYYKPPGANAGYSVDKERPFDFPWAEMGDPVIIVDDVFAKVQQRLRDFLAQAHEVMLSDREISLLEETA